MTDRNALLVSAATHFQGLADSFSALAALTETPEAPSQTPTLTPTPVAGPALDFGKVSVTVGAVQVPIGAPQAYVPVTLDRAVDYTVIIELLTQNNTAREGAHFARLDTNLIFRPGETQHYVTIKLNGPGSDGLTFNVILPTQAEPTVPGITKVNGSVTWKAGAVNTLPVIISQTYPAPITNGETLFSLTPANFKAKDGGGFGFMNTALPGGQRDQPGNQEPTLYTDPVLYPGTTPYRTDAAAIYLRSEVLPSPMSPPGKPNAIYQLGASVLTTENWQTFLYGRFAAVMKLPSCPNRWPGFWLYGHGTDEADIMEVTVASYAATDSNAALHGPNTVSAKLHTPAILTAGIDLTADFHEHAFEWRPDWMVWFIDGQEVYRTKNTLFNPLFLLLDMTLIRRATPANTDLSKGNELAVKSVTVTA